MNHFREFSAPPPPPKEETIYPFMINPCRDILYQQSLIFFWGSEGDAFLKCKFSPYNYDQEIRKFSVNNNLEVSLF